jgi:hypothetical protein
MHDPQAYGDDAAAQCRRRDSEQWKIAIAVVVWKEIFS